MDVMLNDLDPPIEISNVKWTEEHCLLYKKTTLHIDR
jgi:hypothetical protein